MLKSKLYWRVLANFGLLLIILTTMTFLTLRILSQIEQNFNIASADIKTLANIEKVRRYINDVPAAANEYAFTASPLAKAIYETGWKEFDDALNTLKKDYADSSTIQDLKQVRELYFGWMQNVGDKLVLLGENKNLQKDSKTFQEQLRLLAKTEADIQYIPNARKIIRELYSRKIASQPRNIELATGLSSDLGKFIGLVNILLAVFALALGFVLTRSITKPIRLLKEGTQNIMAGKFEAITLNRTDEL
ncbi:MAG: hypothetical protein HY089_07180, partial [Ignavibacteriales bacterium]|nr:hypothetical protein [Ignavibacteriales bacterium]